MAQFEIKDGVAIIPDGTYLALTAINVPVGKADFYKQRLHKRLHDKIVELAPEKKTKK